MIYVILNGQVVSGPHSSTSEAEAEITLLTENDLIELGDDLSVCKVVNTYKNYVNNVVGYETKFGKPKKD